MRCDAMYPLQASLRDAPGQSKGSLEREPLSRAKSWPCPDPHVKWGLSPRQARRRQREGDSLGVAKCQISVVVVVVVVAGFFVLRPSSSRRAKESRGGLGGPPKETVRERAREMRAKWQRPLSWGPNPSQDSTPGPARTPSPNSPRMPKERRCAKKRSC